MGCLKLQVIFAKEPLIIGLFGGKLPMKIRHHITLSHSVARMLHGMFDDTFAWIGYINIYVFMYILMYVCKCIFMYIHGFMWEYTGAAGGSSSSKYSTYNQGR